MLNRPCGTGQCLPFRDDIMKRCKRILSIALRARAGVEDFGIFGTGVGFARGLCGKRFAGGGLGGGGGYGVAERADESVCAAEIFEAEDGSVRVVGF